jgi:hypothetical protein
MSEKSNTLLEKDQESTSLKIENEILELLDGDLKVAALGFVSYLMAHQMTPRQWFGPTYWRISYQEYYLCGIHMKKDLWRFWFFSGEYGGTFGKRFIEAVQSGVKSCISCVDDCPRGKDITVFGTKFIKACYQFPIQFENPDGITLEYIKELLEYCKKVMPYSDSWHCR